MNDNTIITINRECGTGGGEIARLLGENLGIKVYGRTMLEAVAQQFGAVSHQTDEVLKQINN